MDIRSRRAPGNVVEITLAGELDMETSPGLERAIGEALARQDIRIVVLDLAEVTFCDSSGIAVLDKGYGAATRQGAGLRLANVPRPVSRVLEIVGVLDTLTQPAT